MVTALSDGLIAIVIILVSILLVGIALFCIRFILLVVIEEDYREIGIMKALGIQTKDIQKLT
ncbi:MAG: hypothetical protein LBM95_06505 [Lactobacillales bacterium]|jgi:putative ABC transport system permease protein|nr:hypothetical protein [Lactobacillales bacterium]